VTAVTLRCHGPRAAHVEDAVIPSLTSAGELPRGRYPADLEEIETAFVEAPDLAGSSTRRQVWRGFLEWLDAWSQLEARLGVAVLGALWVGGSFTSLKLDPTDIDVAPIVDRVAVLSVRGQPGAGALKRMIGHRDGIKARFQVESFPVPWQPVVHPFQRGQQPVDEVDYLRLRGTMDDYWQRLKPADGLPRSPELDRSVATWR
jgi:hypothetical protein